ncbi:MAG: type II secretion system protein [Bdellovibrio sp.]|nr:type II secretion system protein [Bdellovibrio sp.]
MFLRIKNRQGLTLIESVVAMALLGIVVSSAISLTSFYVSNVSKKSRLLATATAIETAILDHSQDLERIRPLAPNLMRGQRPAEFSVNSKDGFLLASLGAPVHLTEEGKSCFGTANCPIETSIDIKCFPSTAYPDCRLAYSIFVRGSEQGKIQLQRIGTAKLPFTDQDYTVLLPYDIFSQSLENDCSDQANSYVMTGFNNNTGQVYCASTPTLGCPTNQIPVGIIFVPSALGGGRFEMKCVDTRRALCPTNYVLSRFSPQTLDSRVAAQTPQCVFVGKSKEVAPGSITASPPLAPTRVCQENYRATMPLCSVVWQDTPVTCGKCQCNCQTTCANADPSSCTTSCDTCGGEGTLLPNHGECSPAVSEDTIAASVSSAEQPSCRCGGKPSAVATSITVYGISCELTVPEVLPGVVQ